MATPERLIPKGTLKGHTDIVTAIATPIGNSDQIVTCSRDKSLMIWRLTPENTSSYTPIDASTAYGYSYRRLTGHSHFVQDVVLSLDGQFALSASWDSELRLWDLQTSKSTRRFVGHRKDVLSVSFSGDNRQIVSASRDRTMKLWNTLGECKFTFTGPESHVDWISAVRFSPVHPVLVSGSWDKTVKLWDLNSCKHIRTLYGHKGYVNTVAVSPDGSLCVSGGKDGVVMLWDLGEGKRLYELNAGSIIHALCFSPTRYWLCAATEKCVVVWDLENDKVVQELFSGLHEAGPPPPSIPPLATDGPAAYLPPPPPPMRRKNERIFCTSLNWSADGSTLFTGYTDGVIRVWGYANNPYM